MYLLLNSSESSLSRYHINNCNFTDNQLPSYTSDITMVPPFVPHLNDYIGLGLGGGMGIVLMNNVTQIEVVISSSSFINNRAPWGAGLCIQFQDQTCNNYIHIVNTSFSGNTAFHGGGGANVRLPKDSEQNLVVFQGVVFSNNTAEYGGGTSITARVSDINSGYKQRIVAEFCNCTWVSNYGAYSPALDASPFTFDHLSEGIFPSIAVYNSLFTNNHMKLAREKSERSYYINSGAFTIARLSVKFYEHIFFENNSFSALALLSARAEFKENVHISFRNNTGFTGGAILMYGISALFTASNSYFEFIGNEALVDGGAIYYRTIQPLEFFHGRACFLQYKGTEENVLKRNLTFTFKYNTAKYSGSSIYSSTFHGCFYNYLDDLNAHDIKDFFNHIGNFSFEDEEDINGKNVSMFSSYGHKFVGQVSSVQSIPGQLVDFDLELWDEFSQPVHTNLAVQVDKDNSNITLNSLYTDGNSIRVYGIEGSNGTLIFSQANIVHKVYFPINVTLLDCAPGYFYDNGSQSCRCSADVHEQAYPFMLFCNYSKFRAYIARSYWVGYYPPNKMGPLYLYTSFCPSQLCRLSKHVDSHYLLPNTSKELNDFVCVENRTSTLCGLCKEGFSTLYHSRQLSCSKVSKRQCNIGPLFYILSEIIPVSLLFAIIMVLDISFTSGSINGLIFFSQIQNYITIDFNYYTDADSKLFNQTYLLILQHGYHVIYGVLNMEFLNIEPLSFCLFKDSQIMHVLVFKYFTTTYALILILLLVALMNYSRCGRLCRMRRRFNAKTSVTNGISAFLVICYTQCARVTFYILMKAELVGNKKMGSNHYVTVTYFGGLPYFKGGHLFFAVPAVVVLITFVVLPPLYLISFPLVLHLLALCGLSEHPAVTKMIQLLQVNRLKPLLDTFQFNYKDKMRFFAGLYFMYRVAILSIHSRYQGDNQVFLRLSALLLVLFLGVSSIAQPYISRKHNIIDSLLLLNLTAINGLTLFCIESQRNTDKMGKTRVTKALTIGLLQLILLYIPLITCLCVLLYKFIQLFHHHWLCRVKNTIIEDADNEEREMLLDHEKM